MSKSKKEDMTPAESTTVPMNLPIRKMDGSPTGETVELDARLFGLPRNDHVLYLAVKTEQTNRRQGNHSTKSRAQVSGGGRKPWRQKGRGTARAGTSSSPIWRGGGITFGPQTHPHHMRLPAKVKRLARRVALSVKAQSGSIMLVEDFDLETPKTSRISNMLKAFEMDGKSALLMINGNKPVVVKSGRNIPRFEIRDSMTASTFDILRARKVLISKTALEALVGGLIDEKK